MGAHYELRRGSESCHTGHAHSRPRRSSQWPRRRAVQGAESPIGTGDGPVPGLLNSGMLPIPIPDLPESGPGSSPSPTCRGRGWTGPSPISAKRGSDPHPRPRNKRGRGRGWGPGRPRPRAVCGPRQAPADIRLPLFFGRHFGCFWVWLFNDNRVSGGSAPSTQSGGDSGRVAVWVVLDLQNCLPTEGSSQAYALAETAT
jgi:hypothetical protein